ncbi:hypothetical protein FACS1894110_19980 [Spirochaetia bacterium]|nr:hypothetical protein FACS1894110_19980 [Spirochaetia bacterium]
MDENEGMAQDESDFEERTETNFAPKEPCQCKGKNRGKPILMTLGGIVIATVGFLFGRISGEYNN